MRQRTLFSLKFIIVVTIVISLNLAGCASNMLSATFDESATVVRNWGEACIKGNFDKAETKVSIENYGTQETCQYLASTTDNLEIIAIEDRGSLINSGKLIMYVENMSDGGYIKIEVGLANSERGPVIYNVYCSSCR